MNNLSLHIEYLLTQHDCVVVPGWGALVVQHNPATIASGNIITPPRRWISFNPLLAHNDAMLVHSVMRSLQCSYDEAMTSINEQIAQWNDTLSQGKVLSLDNIGSFSLQENNAILFTEATSSIINKGLDILPTIELPLLTDIISLNDEDEHIEHDAPVKISWLHRTTRTIASIAAIVIIMLFISTPIDNFQPDNNYAGLVAAELLSDYNTASPDTTLEPRSITINTTTEDDDIQPIIANDNTPSQIETLSDNNTITTPAITQESLPRFILVIGSLPTKALAQKQIAEFVEMGITDHINIFEGNGRYRLYIEGYNTIHEAQERLDEINAQAQTPVAGIWICSTR